MRNEAGESGHNPESGKKCFPYLIPLGSALTRRAASSACRETARGLHFHWLPPVPSLPPEALEIPFHADTTLGPGGHTDSCRVWRRRFQKRCRTAAAESGR